MPLCSQGAFRLGAVVVIASVSPLAATETDERIVAAARGSYNFKTYLADDKIVIVVTHGAVTLTGEVLDDLHKSLAEETLAGLPGVTRVTNHLLLLADLTAAAPSND